MADGKQQWETKKRWLAALAEDLFSHACNRTLFNKSKFQVPVAKKCSIFITACYMKLPFYYVLSLLEMKQGRIQNIWIEGAGKWWRTPRPRSANSLTTRIQDPGSSSVLDALSCNLILILKHSDTKQGK